MSQKKSERTIIFIGAGFSKILGLPTTTDFSNLIKSCKDNELFSLLNSYLGDDIEDIEKVLYAMESFKSEDSFLNYFINQYNNGNNAFNTVKDKVSDKKFKADIYLTQLKEGIYRILSKFETEKAYNLYFNLLREICSFHSKSKITFVTTNYDMTFEDAWDDNENSLHKLGFKGIDYGFRPKNSKMIFNESYSCALDELEYIKLHGSLDWSYNSSGKCVKGSTVEPRELNSHPLLYPGFKGKPVKQPFLSLHKKLKSYLLDRTTVYVIGFAFRDFYINDIFENALEHNSDLRVKFYNPISIDDFPEDSAISHLMSINNENFVHIQERVENIESPLKLKDQLALVDFHKVVV